MESKAVTMLREFADFKGDGMRGVVRMLVMQEKAQKYLETLDKRREAVQKAK